MLRKSYTFYAKKIISIFDLSENDSLENEKICALIRYLHTNRFISVIEMEDCNIGEPAKKLNYRELLIDQRWLTVSLEIKVRDGFKCKLCDSDKMLNVHHSKYTVELPWNEPKENLITLCKKCHSKFHEVDNNG